jgi:molybdopterin molybdotransferase
MIEQTEDVGEDLVRFTGRETGDNIRRRGEDIKASRVVLHKGVRIGPEHIAVLATVGNARPLVAKRPRVAVIATGAELVQPSAKPGPSQIRNSNGPQLVAQIEEVGAVSRDCVAAGDVPAEIDKALKAAMRDNDVVLISGGVSAGEFDYVPAILRQNDINVLFHKVAVKPGKPTLFGLSEDVYCFGLPGNPVSTFVTFELFVKPFLYKLMGHDYSPVSVEMLLSEAITRKDTERQNWIPAKIIDAQTVRPVEYHGSAHILAMPQADGLIRMEIGQASIERGSNVCVRLV